MGFFSSIRTFFSSDSAPARDEEKRILTEAPTDEVLREELLPEEILPEEILPDEFLPEEFLPEEFLPDEPLPEEDRPAIESTDAALPEKSPAVEPSPARPASSMDEESRALTLALREAEPRLSAWLAIILDGVDTVSDKLWKRLLFLLSSLEAPEDEARAFVHSFRTWAEAMGYEAIEDFRSELQYRLALALDLEDEEDEKSRLIIKISEGLARTRAQISRNLNALFVAGRAIDEGFWEELEETLLMADVGVNTAVDLTKRLKSRALEQGITETGNLRAILREEMVAVFKPLRRISAVNPPEVVLVVGVNGAGKTTTIAKLSHRDQLKGKKVMLVAGDTFRAAATEQLGVWAERTGALFYAKGHGADPAAVAYEALDKAILEGVDTVFVDTAGRLQTKTNLMEELAKVRRVLTKRHPGAPHRTILVLDATTGQNALSQVKLFDAACPVDDIILTKLDGTAKGGIAAAIAMQFSLPISFVGLGEKMEDLRPFDADAFVSALLGHPDEGEAQ